MKNLSVTVATCLAALACVTGCGGSNRSASGTRSADGSPSLAWPAPRMRHPTVIDLTSKSTSLQLDPRTDYVLRLPRGHALDIPSALEISGGHNVVMIGGTINVERPVGVMQLTDQTGTVHIEGVRFTGRHLTQGIDLSEAKGAVVELEHVYFSTVYGSFTTNHAELIQSWAGPRRLLVDGLVGSTTYQGLFLLPNQHYNGPAPQLFDLRNVYIDDSRGAYALWLQTAPRVPLHLSGVYVRPNPQRPQRDWWLWPKPSSGARTWAGVHAVSESPFWVDRIARSAGVGYE